MSREPAILDTSVVVRYLTNDPKDLGALAAALIDTNDQPLVLTEVVLLEAAYVLESVYDQPRAAVVDTLVDLVQRRNIRLDLAKSLVVDALHLCHGSRKVSFGDALIWARAHHQGVRRIYTFDRRFPGSGVDLHTPG